MTDSSSSSVASSSRVWRFVQVSSSDSPSAWQLDSEPLALPLASNQLLIETVLVSVDPYLKIQQSRKDSWQAPQPIGIIQSSFAIGRVLESSAADIAVGAYVRTYSGWRERAVVNVSDVELLPYRRGSPIALEHFIGALGMVGRSAWFGVAHVFEPIAPGETAFVTGAAGAVGSLVVQLLKKRGCFVVGSAGSDDKCALLRSLGCDVALNYKTTPIDAQHVDALRDAFGGRPINLMFDNTGGPQFDAAIQLIAVHARIAICGQVSMYDSIDAPPLVPAFLHRLIYTRAKIQGFLQRDATEQHKRDHVANFSAWLESGELQAPFTVVRGFEQIPQAQCDMMKGANAGKMVVRLVD
jgi:NADPH-dependent curcumin reductase CurA